MSDELPDHFIVVEIDLNRIWLIERAEEGCWTQKIWGRHGWHNHDSIGEPSARMLFQSEQVFIGAE